MRIFPKSYNKRKASALAIILAVVTLITVLAVTLMLTTQFERTSSSSALGRAQATLLSDFAADTAIAKIREGILAGTYNNTTNNKKTWASMPGRIAVFNLTLPRSPNAPATTYYDLFSGLPGPDVTNFPDLNNVDLNKPSAQGKYPIATPTTASPGTIMKVGWINLTANSGSSTTASNPLIGRIAYWVDDDTCKVNINTADGTHKTDLYPDGSVNDGSQPSQSKLTPYFTGTISATGTAQSYGYGTPSEISLAALPLSGTSNTLTGTNTLMGGTTSIAAAIAAYASGSNSVSNSTSTISGFNSTAEIGRAFILNGINAGPPGYYETNKFNITYTGKTPELNMFGEPRIYLMPVEPYDPPTVGGPAVGISGTMTMTQLLGATGNSNNVIGSGGSEKFLGGLISAPIGFVYPLSEQLPLMTNGFLPQFPALWTDDGNWNGNGGNNMLGMRIANYLNGVNSQGQAVQWPDYGTGASGPTAFSAKYNTRQIDSITLQIMDMISQADMSQEWRGQSDPSVIKGFLSGSFVSGFARGEKLTEIALQFILSVNAQSVTISGTHYNYQFSTVTVGSGSPNGGACLVFYFPRYFAGYPLQPPYYGEYTRIGQNNGNPPDITWNDAPVFNTTTQSPSGPAPDGKPFGYWGNNLFYFTTTGSTAAVVLNDAVDLTGNSNFILDPDKANAQQFHPWTYKATTSGTGYFGSFSISSTTAAAQPMLCFPQPQTNALQTAGQKFYTWYPGSYHMCMDAGRSINVPYPGMSGSNNGSAPPILSATGGIAITTCGVSGGGCDAEFAPLGQLSNQQPSNADTTVIPISGVFSGGGALGGGTLNIVVGVADPEVNKFPGDWHNVTIGATTINPTIGPNSPLLETTSLAGQSPCFGTGMYGAGSFPALTGGTSIACTGDSSLYVPAIGSSGTGTADPLCVWAPPQDPRMPKLAAFPSVGALNSIRTGICPDSLSGTAGIPWRSISFASTNSVTPAQSSGQKSTNGTMYPDWVMLDLFTVPFVPQPVAYITTYAAVPQAPARLLTFGGATEGRLNINNPLTPYPFVSGPWAAPQRKAPLQALLYNLYACTTSTSYTTVGSGTSGYYNPVYAPVDVANSGTLAAAIQNYFQTGSNTMNPFMLPGELANVPAVAGFTYTHVPTNAISRNDLLRQIVGATTTQSNTYSIWTVAQTVKKRSSNTNYGIFEPGDTVTGEVRRHYVVERYIEPGTDGVPGNAANPGNIDNIVGTEDDVMDGDMTQPSNLQPGKNPKLTYPLPYRWRILSVEDVAR